MAVATPKYWEDKKVFGELVEVETAHGNKVKIPKRYLNGWESAQLGKAYCESRGLDPLDGLEKYEEVNPLYCDLERVFYEVYQEKK